MRVQIEIISSRVLAVFAFHFHLACLRLPLLFYRQLLVTSYSVVGVLHERRGVLRESSGFSLIRKVKIDETMGDDSASTSTQMTSLIEIPLTTLMGFIGVVLRKAAKWKNLSGFARRGKLLEENQNSFPLAFLIHIGKALSA